MTLKRKHIPYICTLLAFIAGCFFEYGLKNHTGYTLDKTIDPVELLTLIFTIIIAVAIPFVLEKLIENIRGVKSLLIEEIKELIEIARNAERIVETAYSDGTFTEKNKREILYKFHLAGLKVVSIREQVSIAFSDKCDDVSGQLKDLLFAYEDFLTGGALMHKDFKKIDDAFYKENATQFSKIETGLKKLIQQIHRY